MNEIVTALNYLDDELIFSALESVKPAQRVNAKTVNVKPETVSHANGATRVKAAVISVAAFALCAILTITLLAVFVWGGNHAEDSHAHGNQKILSGFSEIYDYFPDRQAADAIAALELINYGEEGVQLYYENDWQNPEDWNSLLLSGSVADTDDFAILYCLFKGTLQEWSAARPVYKSNSEFITVGETSVRVAYHTLPTGKYESYALYEKNGVVYELSIVNDADNSQQLSILHSLLT